MRPIAWRADGDGDARRTPPRRPDWGVVDAMMRDTPRMFVGSVVFLLTGPICGHLTDAVRARVGQLPGISRCDVDAGAGRVLVTADVPVDRTDLVAILDRLGCRVKT